MRRPREEKEKEKEATVLITNNVEEFFKKGPFDVVIEASGQQTVRDHFCTLLEAGTSCICTSIGALTDDDLRDKLKAAAIKGNSQLLLASGAMPALDWMHSSALDYYCAQQQHVTAIQTKPPESWKGARFAPGTTDQLPDVIDFDSTQERTVFFEGSAREAASYYPKNSNILAMLALATAGLDKTQVCLVSDPKGMGLRVEYEGSAGKLSVEVMGKKSPTNPRTSQVVPLSVIKALSNIVNPVAFGV